MYTLAVLCDVAVAELTHATLKLRLDLLASAAESVEAHAERKHKPGLSDLSVPRLDEPSRKFSTPVRHIRKWTLKPRAVPNQLPNRHIHFATKAHPYVLAHLPNTQANIATPDTYALPPSPPPNPKKKRTGSVALQTFLDMELSSMSDNGENIEPFHPVFTPSPRKRVRHGKI